PFSGFLRKVTKAPSSLTKKKRPCHLVIRVMSLAAVDNGSDFAIPCRLYPRHSEAVRTETNAILRIAQIEWATSTTNNDPALLRIRPPKCKFGAVWGEDKVFDLFVAAEFNPIH